jgi:apolipoprotein D and lipocalin family protein
MNKSGIFPVCPALFLCLLVSSCSNKIQMNTIDTSTVDNLEIDRYLGTWYEIARFPHRFEKNLEGVTATYSLRDDGKIRVVNRGYRGSLDGKPSKAVGKAKIPDPDEPGRLKVSFFLFFYSDYFVLELDEDYRWAMIGSSSPDYFWILSRSPQMDQEVLEMLLETARRRGYNLDQLVMVKQPGL